MSTNKGNVCKVKNGWKVSEILKSDLLKIPMKGKPPCPYCENPVSFIYENATGLINAVCPKCKHKVLLDATSQTVFKIIQN